MAIPPNKTYGSKEEASAGTKELAKKGDISKKDNARVQKKIASPSKGANLDAAKHLMRGGKYDT